MTVSTRYSNIASHHSFVHYTTSYEQGTTIQHWQLRDLVHTDTTGSKVFCVNGRDVICLDTKTRQASVVCQPYVVANGAEKPFQPTSLTVSNGYLAAGGSQQQLYIERLGPTGDGAGSAKHFAGCVGGTVNNALHIGRDTGGNQLLFVCNNDDTVRIYPLPDMPAQPIQTLKFEVAINYAALSPDGRQLACVGDRPHVYLYTATPTGFRKSVTLVEAQDAGMCAAWSPGGSEFAAAHQDGTVAVWDARSKARVEKLRMQQPVRSIKYSSGPMDLLACAEHDKAVTVLDARKLRDTQTLRLQGLRDDRMDISGLAFTPDGTRVYVGLFHNIMQFNVDTLQRRGFPEGSKI